MFSMYLITKLTTKHPKFDLNATNGVKIALINLPISMCDLFFFWLLIFVKY